MSSAETPSPLERLVQEAVEGIEYRTAGPEDAAELALLFEMAFNESGFPSRRIRYSIGRAEAWIEGAVRKGFCPHLMAVREGELIGAMSYSLDSTFCVEPVGIMQMLYIKRPYRRSAIGRVLVGLTTEMAKSDGACAFHAPIAAEVNERSLANLFAHGGFTPIGVIMGRSL